MAKQEPSLESHPKPLLKLSGATNNLHGSLLCRDGFEVHIKAHLSSKALLKTLEVKLLYNVFLSKVWKILLQNKQRVQYALFNWLSILNLSILTFLCSINLSRSGYILCIVKL